MTGLDTNVLLRYLLQDDFAQTRVANRVMERLSPDQPGFINLATILEVVWVLRSLVKLKPVQIAVQVENLLATESLQVQNEEQVFEAAYAMKRGLGEFEDALIASLNRWAGCVETVTFDKGTSKLHGFHVLV